MNKLEFIPDRAIRNSNEDELNRSGFAHQLKNSLANWEDDESLVIAIRGKWGEGKSSVINLLKEQFVEKHHKDDPTIIEFNPWAYSNSDSLSYHFFKDIGSELKIKNVIPNDKKLADKLALYSQLINLEKEAKLFKDIIPNLIILIGIIGITSVRFFEWFNHDDVWLKNIIFFISLSILIMQFFSGVINKVATFFRLKALSKDLSPQGLKKEIISHLKNRKNKLLIIIDDIDRLSQKEISEIFKLIRVNADFPNTIYLLAFDNKIIEENLETQKGISGRDYLKKIVQVDFNLPYTKNDKIQEYLFTELDRVIEKLPKDINIHFNSENQYWANTYHAGYKNFFINIRDVKRYVNSLLFNINLLHREGIFEINPVDFLALEVLRVFEPDLYDYLKFRKDLYTDPPNENSNIRDTKEQRKKELLEAINLVTPANKEHVKKLINHMFPQLDPVLQEYGGIHYPPEFYSTCRKELRICSKLHFDAYFTLNPKENESELTNYDLIKFISTLNDASDTEALLKEYIESNKIRPLLRNIQDYTLDKNSISTEAGNNFILALNNFSDGLTSDRESIFDLGIEMEIVRIMYQLLSKQDKDTNFTTVKNIVGKSTGTFGLLHLISLQTRDESKTPEPLFGHEHLLELQKLIISRVEQLSKDVLLSNAHFLHIINRWKDWSDDEKLVEFISDVKSETDSYLQFINHFIHTTRSVSSASNKEDVHNQIAFDNLKVFMDLSDVNLFINKLEKESKSYNDFDSLIIMFQKDYARYVNNPDNYSKLYFD